MGIFEMSKITELIKYGYNNDKGYIKYYTYLTIGWALLILWALLDSFGESGDGFAIELFSSIIAYLLFVGPALIPLYYWNSNEQKISKKGIGYEEPEVSNKIEERGTSPEKDKYYYLWVNRGKKSILFVRISSFLLGPIGWYFIGRFQKGFVINFAVNIVLASLNNEGLYGLGSIVLLAIFSIYGAGIASDYKKIHQGMVAPGGGPVIEKVVVESKEKTTVVRKCPYCNGRLSELNYFKLKSGNDTTCEYCGEMISA